MSHRNSEGYGGRRAGRDEGGRRNAHMDGSPDHGSPEDHRGSRRNNRRYDNEDDDRNYSTRRSEGRHDRYNEGSRGDRRGPVHESNEDRRDSHRVDRNYGRRDEAANYGRRDGDRRRGGRDDREDDGGRFNNKWNNDRDSWGEDDRRRGDRGGDDRGGDGRWDRGDNEWGGDAHGRRGDRGGDDRGGDRRRGDNEWGGDRRRGDRGGDDWGGDRRVDRDNWTERGGRGQDNWNNSSGVGEDDKWNQERRSGGSGQGRGEDASPGGRGGEHSFGDSGGGRGGRDAGRGRRDNHHGSDDGGGDFGGDDVSGGFGGGRGADRRRRDDQFDDGCGDFGGGGGGGGNWQSNSKEERDRTLDDLVAKIEEMEIEIDPSTGKLLAFVKDFYAEHPSLSAFPEDEIAKIREDNNIHIISGEGVPRPTPTMELASFPQWIEEALTSVFSMPTPVQMQGWPIALSGRDVYGIAETGSGKTVAFLLPAFVHISAQPILCTRRRDGPIVLIISPTRELAQQIHQESQKFSKFATGDSAKTISGEELRLRSTCVYGGYTGTRELESAFAGNTEICVACPGRLMDLITRKMIKMNRVTYLVFDEADKLLSMGFDRQMKAVHRLVRPDRQTSMWSATWPHSVQQLAAEFCQNDPIHVNIGVEGVKTVKSITQAFVNKSDMKDKASHIVQLFQDQVDFRWLVFTNKKTAASWVDVELKRGGIKSVCLTGDKEQGEREWAMAQFRKGIVQVLVATDVLARGIDIPDIYGVVNFDLPSNLETYIHRIGRCGRAGRPGKAINFYDASHRELCQQIKENIVENHLNVSSIAESLETVLHEDGVNENNNDGGCQSADAGQGSFGYKEVAWN